MKEDVLSYTSTKTPAHTTLFKAVTHAAFPTQAPAPAKPAAPLPVRPAPVFLEQDRREPTSFMIKSMSEVLKIPPFGYKDEIDMNKLVELRKVLIDASLARGIKLSCMPFMVKACSMALLHFPMSPSLTAPLTLVSHCKYLLHFL
jgi:2-oxoisovalerate dehydrogenase E2 component (dihydrolipoyl transacylase)